MNIQDLVDLPSSSGIYKITSPRGKVYIGEAKSIRDRFLYYLNPNRIIKQRKIYNSLIKYGVDIHKFEIKEFCDIKFLLERERFWQEYYNSVEFGLNCHYSSTTDKKKIHSEETKYLMSLKSQGINNGFYGKKHSPESLMKISNSSSGENNNNFGSKYKSDEYLKKQSESNSKKPIKIIDCETGNIHIFQNSKEAAEFIGCGSSLIRESKKHGFKVRKRYLVEDFETPPII